MLVFHYLQQLVTWFNDIWTDLHHGYKLIFFVWLHFGRTVNCQSGYMNLDSKIAIFQVFNQLSWLWEGWQWQLPTPTRRMTTAAGVAANITTNQCQRGQRQQLHLQLPQPMPQQQQWWLQLQLSMEMTTTTAAPAAPNADKPIYAQFWGFGFFHHPFSVWQRVHSPCWIEYYLF